MTQLRTHLFGLDLIETCVHGNARHPVLDRHFARKLMQLLKHSNKNHLAEVLISSSIGVAQVPLIGVLRDSVSSVILPRISYLQEQGQTRQILVLMARAARKLAAFYLPMYFVLLSTGQDFLTFMFASRYLQSWPIFAISLTLLPISLIEMDAVIRAYEKHRFFLVIVQLVMSLLMIVAVWFGVTRFGLVGAISAVVVVNFLMRIVLAGRFSRVLGAKWRDISLFKDLGKVVVASGLAALVCFLVDSMVGARNTRPFYRSE